MLDFSELPRDGVKFEQLIREISLTIGLRPHWTGKGPDSGRDLLIKEPLIGRLRNGNRLWLVDCKHLAHSGRSVSVGDIPDIVDRCARVGAKGYLLACSTTVSSETMRKLKELSEVANISFEVWDSVSIERLILTPKNYFIAQQFFQKSLENFQWQIFYTDSEERWMIHYRGYFFYAKNRAGIKPPPLHDLKEIISQLEKVNLAKEENLRVRSVFHDNPRGSVYEVLIDYLFPLEKFPSLSPAELESQLGQPFVDGAEVIWSVRPQITIYQSDYHAVDDPRYYDLEKNVSILSDAARYTVWTEWSPPLIRTFDEMSLWELHREKFGYGDRFNTITVNGKMMRERRKPSV